MLFNNAGIVTLSVVLVVAAVVIKKCYFANDFESWKYYTGSRTIRLSIFFSAPGGRVIKVCTRGMRLTSRIKGKKNHPPERIYIYFIPRGRGHNFLSLIHVYLKCRSMLNSVLLRRSSCTVIFLHPFIKISRTLNLRGPKRAAVIKKSG